MYANFFVIKLTQSLFFFVGNAKNVCKMIYLFDY